MRFIPAVSPVQIQVPLPLQSNRALALSHIRPGGQAAKTPPFHGGNTGSIPVRVTTFFEPSIWRHSSAGRASASHAEGHRFEFCCLHQEEECHTNRCGTLLYIVLRRERFPCPCETKCRICAAIFSGYHKNTDLRDVYQKSTKKGGGGLEFQGPAVPSVFACLPNVYQGNFLGVIPEIFPLIFPFL